MGNPEQGPTPEAESEAPEATAPDATLEQASASAQTLAGEGGEDWTPDWIDKRKEERDATHAALVEPMMEIKPGDDPETVRWKSAMRAEEDKRKHRGGTQHVAHKAYMAGVAAGNIPQISEVAARKAERKFGVDKQSRVDAPEASEAA